MTLRELQDKIYAQDIKRHAKMPVHAVPKKKFSDATANKFTTAILAYLKFKGVKLAYRQSTEGRYRQGEQWVDAIGRMRVMKGRFIPAAKKGLGDVTAVIKGKYVSIEVKIGKDIQRDDQKKFEADLTDAGGAYMIVRDWSDFITKIKKYL